MTHKADRRDSSTESPSLIRKLPFINLCTAIERGQYDSTNGRIFDKLTNTYITLQDAIDEGFISTQHDEVLDPWYGEPMPLYEAINCGLIDTISGRHINLISKVSTPLDKAFEESWLRPALGQVRRSSQSSLMNPSSASSTPIERIRRMTVGSPSTGSSPLKKSSFHRSFSFDNAGAPMIRRDTIDSSYGLAIRDIFKRGLYESSKNLITDPSMSMETNLNEAVNCGLINEFTSYILNTATLEKIVLAEAFEDGPSGKRLVDGEKNLVLDCAANEWLKLGDANLRGLFCTSSETATSSQETPSALTLVEAFDLNLIDSDNNRLQICHADSETVSIQEAMELGILNATLGQVRDRANDCLVSLQEAVRSGLVDSITGHVMDTVTKETHQLHDAIGLGLVLSFRSSTPVRKVGRSLQPKFKPESQTSIIE